MFECRACLQRSIRAIAGETLQSNILLRRKPLFLTPRLLRRYASTATIATKNSSHHGLVPGKQPIDENEAETSSSSPPPNAKGNTDLVIPNRKHLELELRHLPDRVKLAQHVHYTLRNNQPDKALNLCRLASKNQEIVVSWNHVIDWHMQRSHIDTAMKIYNEMKKRAQFPDSYTYILLLRGLAKPHHHGQWVREGNVKKAREIYSSMFGPTSRVRPAVHHTNAVLRVCSAAADMDALWEIVGKMPKKGAGAPDKMTYTILVNAVRWGAFGRREADEVRGIPFQEAAKMKDQAVGEGKRIWEEIITKWRGGEIHIDEGLVCAMGRLLLFSSRMEDWDNVLDLVRQTMRMERLIPPLGHPGRNAEHVPRQDISADEEAAPQPEEEEDSEGYTQTPAPPSFRAVQPLPPDPAHPNRPRTLAWVQPGNPTLSLLIEACSSLRIPATATAYWNLLTNPENHYNLQPDLVNYHSQLKLLAKNRSSAKAAALIQELGDASSSSSEEQGGGAGRIEPKNQTFRIAMSVCVRDKNNTNVLAHARTIIDVMEKTSPDPDLHTLTQYLHLALTTDDGKKIVGVLDRLDPLVHNLRSRVAYGTEETGHMTPRQHLGEKEEIVRVFQTMVGVIDTLMNRGLVPREDFQQWHARRSLLTQIIGRAKLAVDKLRTRLEAESKEEEDGVTLPGFSGARGRARREFEAVRRPKKMQMSSSEWALKTFRWKGRRKQEAERKRLEELEARGDWKMTVNEKRRSWNGGGAEGGGGGFADSAMELSGRE